MKKGLVLFAFLVLLFQSSKAQYSSNLDSLLRNLLLPLTPPTPNSPFFYDLSSHTVDEKYFSLTNNTDTFNSSIWFSVYNELRAAAYDTAILPNGWNLKYKVLECTKKNVVPIGLLYADYNKLIDSIFTDSLRGVYFDWNDDSLWDVTSRNTSPYINNTLFVASTLENYSYFKNVNFSIDSSLLFYNNSLLNSTSTIDTSLRLAIDFGDGGGGISFLN